MLASSALQVADKQRQQCSAVCRQTQCQPCCSPAHLGQGHVLLSLEVELSGIRITAAHALDGATVGLDVDDVSWLQTAQSAQAVAVDNTARRGPHAFSAPVQSSKQ